MKKTKRVRFDFYAAQRVLDPNYDSEARSVADKVRKYLTNNSWFGKRQLEKYQKRLEELNQLQRTSNTGYWDIAALVEYACRSDIHITHPSSSSDLLEIDKTTYFNQDDDLLAFQVTTLRSHDIPAKKKPGQARKDFELDDDEYIGEFTQVIYDTRFHTVAIQSTKHGASVKSVESLLNEIDRLMHPNRVEIGCFQPIVDPEVIDRVSNARKFKKITLKCSERTYGLQGVADHFSQARSFLNSGIESYTMEVSIGFTGRSPEQTLSRDQVNAVISSFKAIQDDPLIDTNTKNDYGVDVTYYDDHNDKYVTVDLLVPKLHFFISVEMEARKVVQSDYMYELVIDAYKQVEGQLSHIMYHRKREGG